MARKLTINYKTTGESSGPMKLYFEVVEAESITRNVLVLRYTPMSEEFKDLSRTFSHIAIPEDLSTLPTAPPNLKLNCWYRTDKAVIDCADVTDAAWKKELLEADIATLLGNMAALDKINTESQVTYTDEDNLNTPATGIPTPTVPVLHDIEFDGEGVIFGDEEVKIILEEYDETA